MRKKITKPFSRIRDIHYAIWIMVACCAIQGGTIGIILNCTRGIFYDPVCQDLGFSLGEFTFYVTIYGIAISLAMPFAGKLIAKVNLRLVTSIAIVLFAGSTIAMGFFTHLYQWYLIAVIQGMSGSFFTSLIVPVLVNNWFERKTGTVMGIIASFSGIIGLIFNPVGSMLIESWGWRAGYLILGALSLAIVLPFTLLVVRFRPEEKGLKPYGYEPDHDQLSVGVQSGISAARALRSSAFYLMIIVSGIIAFSSGYSQHLSKYATSSLGLTATLGATLISCSMIGNMGGKLIFGLINDRIGIRKTLILASCLVCSSFILLMIGVTPFLQIGAVVNGLSMSTGAVLIPLAYKDLFGEKDYITILSYSSMVQGLTSATALTVIGFLFDGTGSYTASFVLGMVSLAVVVVLCFIAFRMKKRLWGADGGTIAAKGLAAEEDAA